jgi:hypothetical protein
MCTVLACDVEGLQNINFANLNLVNTSVMNIQFRYTDWKEIGSLQPVSHLHDIHVYEMTLGPCFLTVKVISLHISEIHFKGLW